MKPLLVGFLVLLVFSAPLQAQSHKKAILKKLAEHVSLGAGIELGMSEIAGGKHKYPVGLSAAALVAGFKESADAIAGADTRKQAAWHATCIMIGAGIAAGVRH